MTSAVTKTSLHPRNLHRERYDFAQLIACSPELAAFVSVNKYGGESIDFADPAAVKALNRALLKLHYQIDEWDIPAQYLCPPIPGRADYIHYLADLLTESNGGGIPRGDAVRVLDIGVGANCIYPLIGHASYGWHFVGTDVDETALANAQHIVDANKLGDAIELRLQPSTADIFSGVTYNDEYFALTLSNPPFHASLAEARKGSQRKWQNLGKENNKHKKPVLNFGGQSLELCCEGGEEAFITRMIEESAGGGEHCLWFTTLVSKSTSLPQAYSALKHFGAVDSRTIEMAQGQKKSRLLAWTFMDKKQRKAWWEKHGKQ
ncbi:MAG: 23S rRNA (adenine(1618)-N(6))-methyltransferase RlmF [Halothiobacillaceae bacterium]|nr:23S rRNA (adenine(1618)-N(6))-methyltransferase RlmF [Halothiobacillaceae bacterium]